MSEYSIPTQFIDLAAQQSLIRGKLDAAIKSVLDHGQYIMGPEVKTFEANLKNFANAKYAITCANGTDALTLVLMAWGVGPGDAVFVPSFTYVATAEAPAQLGAIPFFVDVRADTFNMDPESLKQAIIDCRESGLKPSTVIPVDLFGQPSEIDKITDIAHSEEMKVLVDAAQSFGGTYRGRSVGTMGDATTTSFFPAKPLGCYGDGGAVFTQNENDAELIDSIRLHGKGSEKYDNVRIGVNSRLDTIQAAILIEKLKLFREELSSRQKVANKYSDSLMHSKQIVAPKILDEATSAWAQYTVQLPDGRDNYRNKLSNAGIPAAIYYPTSLCSQGGYKNFPSVSGGTPVSRKAASRVLSLPMHPYLSDEQIDNIIRVLNQ